jgi:hypothetical protein
VDFDERALARTLSDQAGVVTRRQVPAKLWPRTRWALESGRWQRGHDGIFVNHAGAVTREQRIWIAVLGGGPDAAIAGPTAAELAGLTGFQRPTIHVVVPRKREGPSIDGVSYHRAREYADQVTPNLEPRRIALPFALIAMAAAAYSDLGAYHVLTAAVQQNLVRTRDLRKALATRRSLRRRAVILETLLDIDDGAQSFNEVAMLRLVKRHGLPLPLLQAVCATERRRSRLDGGWPDLDVYFEIDGVGHFEVAKWYDDADRQNEVALSVEPGSTLLRWPGFVVRHEPERVVDQAMRALIRGGWTPSR